MKFSSIIKSALIGLTVAAAAPAAMAAVTAGQINYLNSLYNNGLGRIADAGGMAFYIEKLNEQVCSQAQAASLASTFFGSPELQSQHLPSSELVNRIFVSILGRDPAVGELLYYSQFGASSTMGPSLDPKVSTTTFSAETLASLARQFVYTDEFRTQRLPAYCR
ncbi:DUF4214 domain-containing protein [Parachitinimonas caeni]|uniref:DUF4214 domain-containing protein n=1 Tax=Parachitinimonas caeni TaxID=3031301 RepID=A0ABT7E0E1_9NEIS|nr:DUF4214 domain-containing protein [Parachitinimonas caeni]MDK2125775.1 DUF4214 domain-containing protein [Parachitinimonas caeni]